MPKPKPYSPPVGFKAPTPAIPSTQPFTKPSHPRVNPIAYIPPEKRLGKPAALPDLTSVAQLSVDKHVDKLRYKIVYVADKLADDLSRAVSKPNKKDKEYIKGLVWSLGVLFDKLASGASQDAVIIRIPARLLDSVKAVIAIQASKKAEPKAPALESVSSGNVIESTCYTVPVADVVALPVTSAEQPTSPSGDEINTPHT